MIRLFLSEQPIQSRAGGGLAGGGLGFVVGGGRDAGAVCRGGQDIRFGGGAPRQGGVVGGGEVVDDLLVADQNHGVSFNAIHAKPHGGSFLPVLGHSGGVSIDIHTIISYILRFFKGVWEIFRGKEGAVNSQSKCNSAI